MAFHQRGHSPHSPQNPLVYHFSISGQREPDTAEIGIDAGISSQSYSSNRMSPKTIGVLTGAIVASLVLFGVLVQILNRPKKSHYSSQLFKKKAIQECSNWCTGPKTFYTVSFPPRSVRFRITSKAPGFPSFFFTLPQGH